jgi:hypothetical protein
MKPHDLAALLYRAAAALETPLDLSQEEVTALIADLVEAANELQP